MMGDGWLLRLTLIFWLLINLVFASFAIYQWIALDKGFDYWGLANVTHSLVPNALITMLLLLVPRRLGFNLVICYVVSQLVLILSIIWHAAPMPMLSFSIVFYYFSLIAAIYFCLRQEGVQVE